MSTGSGANWFVNVWLNVLEPNLTFGNTVGILSLIVAIWQGFKIRRIQKLDYHAALNVALDVQRAIAHTDDAKVAMPPSLPEKVKEAIVRAQTTLSGAIQKCGESLAQTHKVEFIKEYQRLVDEKVIHGQLLRAIKVYLPLKGTLPEKAMIEITNLHRGYKVGYEQKVTVESSLELPVNLFVWANDYQWHAQPTLKPTNKDGEWEGIAYFGDRDSKPGGAYRIVAVAAAEKISGKFKTLPEGVTSKILDVVRRQ